MASDKMLDKAALTAMVELMLPFPASVNQLMAMSSDLNCAPKDLVGVIERDPVLTMKILKMVNSAFFSLSRDVASVQHALVYLGMNTVKNLAVSIATVAALPRQSIPELPMASFLTHALMTASAAQYLAKACLQIRDTSDYFVGGLLHGFGQVVLIQSEPDIYANILSEARASQRPLAQVEIECLGMSYADVGAALAEYWQLPETLVECIRMHVCCAAQSSDLTLCVAAANVVARAIMRPDETYEFEKFPEFMQQRLGSDLATMMAQMQHLPQQVQQMQSAVAV